MRSAPVVPVLSAADRALVARDAARRRFDEVRRRSLDLTRGLSKEDQAIQSMPDVSPTKWHLAHATWFFETFILRDHQPDFRPFDPDFAFLFNSYYEAEGPRHPRPRRGLLSRPPLSRVLAYRAAVDHAMDSLIAEGDDETWAAIAPLLELGLHHEQQHQELMLMDIKHVFWCNPLLPAYQSRPDPVPPLPEARCSWVSHPAGLYEIGHGGAGFAFDNEGPRHRVWLGAFRIASRPVSNGDYLRFIEDGGYRRPDLWLSDGWAMAAQEDWRAPLYWFEEDGAWRVFTLAGAQWIDPARPVCNISQYEADAYARWAGHRLPTEAEWEIAVDKVGMTGIVWEWTASPYVPYPRYRPSRGALGEYNGKFMSGQMVLRGGSFATPPGHARDTYRNFFPPGARWAFSGVRLADDA